TLVGSKEYGAGKPLAELDRTRRGLLQHSDHGPSTSRRPSATRPEQPPLALDLYGWATYKTYAVTMKGQPPFVSSHDFMAQLGAGCGTVKDFQEEASRLSPQCTGK